MQRYTYNVMLQSNKVLLDTLINKPSSKSNKNSSKETIDLDIGIRTGSNKSSHSYYLLIIYIYSYTSRCEYWTLIILKSHQV
jgi:hypothetical protein